MPVAVLARVVPQQVVDRADAEVLLERLGGLGADDVVQPSVSATTVYSTPISSASPPVARVIGHQLGAEMLAVHVVLQRLAHCGVDARRRSAP